MKTLFFILLFLLIPAIGFSAGPDCTASDYTCAEIEVLLDVANDVGSVSGIVKSDGGDGIEAAVAGTDYASVTPTTQAAQDTDSGDGNKSTTTLTPAAAKLVIVSLTVNDSDGWQIDLQESSATAGDVVILVNISANSAYLAYESGVFEANAGSGNEYEIKQYGSLSMTYANSTWVLIANETSSFFYSSISSQTPTIADPDNWTMSGDGMRSGIWIANAAGTGEVVSINEGDNFTVKVRGAYAVQLGPPSGGTLCLNGTCASVNEHLVSDGTSGAEISCVYSQADELDCSGVNFAEATP